MKIGILTFHWATNYGAILQAYALQKYLESIGNEVYVINYRPKNHKKTLINCFFTLRFYLYLSRIKEYIREQKLEKFRKKYLRETVLYSSSDELKKNPPKMDIYICGSDQIWNPSFTTMGEGKPTSVYFLDFGDKSIKRLAYAISFGCEVYPITAMAIANEYINNFHAITVRENSAINIIEKIGYKEPITLPDPTLLLPRDSYLLDQSTKTTNEYAFIYTLRSENSEIKKIKAYLKSIYQVEIPKPGCSVEEWVNKIRNAKVVFTNSFHGMIFSLIFHVPFIVVLENGYGSGMNDRFKTLLNYLNLEQRIINRYDMVNLTNLIEELIDWEKIDNQIELLRLQSKCFFSEVLN